MFRWKYYTFPKRKKSIIPALKTAAPEGAADPEAICYDGVKQINKNQPNKAVIDTAEITDVKKGVSPLQDRIFKSLVEAFSSIP